MGSGSGPLAITTRSAKNMRVNSGSMLLARGLADDFLILGADHSFRAALCGHGLMRTIKPIELLVLVSFTPRGASTSSLSTWWSSTALKGMLVLKEASCLDAFSSYPVRI